MGIHAKEITYESGNITLASAVGAHLYRMENCSFSEADNRMDKLAEKLISEGKKPYIIPRGGSSAASIWGYIECWQEMERQGSYQYSISFFGPSAIKFTSTTSAHQKCLLINQQRIL